MFGFELFWQNQPFEDMTLGSIFFIIITISLFFFINQTINLLIKITISTSMDNEKKKTVIK